MEHDLTADKNKPTPRLGLVLWAGFISLLTFIFFRVQSYTSGQDSFAYLQIAQELIYQPHGLKDALKGWLEFGPGWTATLALARLLFGTIAPYWVTPLAFIGLQFVLYRFLKRILITPAKAFCATTFTTWIMLSAFSMSPYFLLYPFRGTFCYFLGFLAIMLGVTAAEKDHGKKRLLASALCFGYAILVRETMVFVCAAMALYLLSARIEHRWRKLLVFSLPFLFPLLVFIMATAITGSFGTEQLGLWWKYLSVRYEAGMGELVQRVALGMLHFGYEALGWWGLGLLAVALIRFRTHRAFICLLIVPAIVLFAFYSLYDVAHRRYVLSILMFLVPAAGCGLVFIADLLSRRLPFPAERLFYSLSLVWMILLGVQGARMTALWEVDINGHEARAFKQTIAEHIDPDDALVTEWYFNYLGEAIVAQTPNPFLQHPFQVAQQLATGRTCYYLKPLDPKSVPYKAKRYYKVHVEQLLSHQYNLVPVSDPSGAVHISFNDFPFQLFRIQPREEHEIRQAWTPRSTDDRFLWLNFGAADGDKTIQVKSASNEEVTHTLPNTSGLVLIALPDTFSGEAIELTVKSDAPLPHEPILGFQKAGKFVFFELDQSRFISVERWFPEPFYQYDRPETAARAALFKDQATVFLPPMPGRPPAIDLALFFGPLDRTAGSGTMEFLANGKVIHQQPFDTSAVQTRAYLTLPNDQTDVRKITLRVQADAPLDSYLCIYRLGIRLHTP